MVSMALAARRTASTALELLAEPALHSAFCLLPSAFCLLPSVFCLCTLRARVCAGARQAPARAEGAPAGRRRTSRRPRGVRAPLRRAEACSRRPIGSARARFLRLLRGVPGGSGRLGTPRSRPGRWDASHCLSCSSELPPKSPTPQKSPTPPKPPIPLPFNMCRRSSLRPSRPTSCGRTQPPSRSGCTTTTSTCARSHRASWPGWGVSQRAQGVLARLGY